MLKGLYHKGVKSNKLVGNEMVEKKNENKDKTKIQNHLLARPKFPCTSQVQRFHQIRPNNIISLI
jgi:hypothetical protein